MGESTSWTITLTPRELEWFEFAVADYVAKWGEHLTGRPYIGEFGPNLAGLPTAVGNMAGTVLRKLVRSDTGLIPDDDIALVVFT